MTMQPDGAVDRYRSLFDNAPDAILIMKDDRFIDCNQAAIDMLGADDKAAVLQLHPSAISPEHQPDGQRSDDKADSILHTITEHGSRYFEWMHVKTDGTLLPVEVSMTAIPDPAGGHQLHISWRDLTIRKRLEQELNHAQRMEALGNLAAGIAHDFNNTLMPIVTYSELLEASLDDQPVHQKWAHEIGRAGMLATSLVKKLMTVSRKEHEPTQPTSIELGATVGGLLRILRRLVGPDITLQFERADTELWVRTEPGDIEQILLNLAANARDAMPRGGHISAVVDVVADGDSSRARLQFSDDGDGMDDATLARIFEPFFTTKQVGRGTGLGLASVREIMQRANGTIEVTSGVGDGTSFTIEFPLVAAPDAAPSSDASAVADGFERIRILVVEDDDQVLRLIADLLDREGYLVHAVNNGLRALEVLDTIVPDLVISDVVMPHMTGPEFVREMTARGIDPPVLFVSGYLDHQFVDSGFDPDEVDVLRKPFAATELSDAVRRRLARGR